MNSAWLRFGLALGLALLVAVASVLPTLPSEVASADAPAHEFSAERAFAKLRHLLGDGRPHPTGSAANRAVRARLEAELRALGLEPRVMRGTACGQYGLCAEVENVVAEIVGRVRTPAVALGCHYDSVSAGPGAGDDGAGVAAILEIARALHAGTELPRSVWLIFTDGEEMGLLGARQLVHEREFLKNIGVLVNLEARGVSGPSLMFETSTPNDGLISALRRSVRRPVTGSAFYSVYKRLPNDTDLTIFRGAGIAGVNFAFIGGTEHYHTPGDNLERLSRASLQHQGEQALELVRELLERGIPEAENDAVFFDVLGKFVVSLPVPLFQGMTVGLLVLGAVCWARSVRRERALGKAAGWAAAAVLACLVLAALLGVALDTALRLRHALDQPWPANQRSIELSAGLLAVFALAVSAFGLHRRFDFRGAFLGCWLVSLVLTAITSWVIPEASYLFALPAAAATLTAALAWRLGDGALTLSALASLIVNTLFWAPVARLASDAIGVAAPALPAALGALLCLPLLPFVVALGARRLRVGAWGSGSVALVSACVALAQAPNSTDNPLRVNLAHHVSADTSSARWLLEAARVPAELASAGFSSNRGDDFPWFGGSLVAQYQAKAPLLVRPAPSLEVVHESSERDGRELVLKLIPGQPGALAFELAMPRQRVSGVWIDGIPATPLALGELAVVGVIGSSEQQVSVRVRLRGRAPVELELAELHSGLPPEGRALSELRDRGSSASQTGDVSIVSQKFRF